MTVKEKMSFERHKEIAEELKKIDSFLVHLYVEFANSYARTNTGGPYGYYNENLLKALNKTKYNLFVVRNHAENIMVTQYAEEGFLGVYFGQPKEEITS